MENNLEVMIRDSGLDKTKSEILLENFSSYFQIAADWEERAKNLIVTNEDQKAEMEMARVGRLFLAQKRFLIEKTRKQLKEQCLREGKAIDGIANVLKALIIPIEKHLEAQEKFVEIKAKEKEELIRLEVEKRMEDERIATEQAEAQKVIDDLAVKEKERIRLKKENEKLAKEKAKTEKKIVADRKKQDAARKKLEKEKQDIIDKAADDRKKAYEEKRQIEEEAERQRKILQDKADLVRLEAERKSREEQAKIRRKKAIAEEKERDLAEKRRIEIKENDRIFKEQQEENAKIQAELDALIECPFCHEKFKLGD